MIHIDLKFFRNLGDLRSCGIRQSYLASFLGLADLMHIAVVGPEILVPIFYTSCSLIFWAVPPIFLILYHYKTCLSVCQTVYICFTKTGVLTIMIPLILIIIYDL